MSKPGTNLRQSPITMVIVLVALMIVIAFRVPGLLPGKSATTPAVVSATELDTDELLPPGNLLTVSEQAAAYRKIAAETPDQLLAPRSEAIATGTVLRNPFREKDGVEKKQSAVKKRKTRPRTDRVELKCSAIFMGGKSPNALINGKILGIGDRIAGYRVAEIDAHGVELSNRGQSLRLELKKRGTGAGPANLVFGSGEKG
jgi:hypothetical protein